MFFFLTEVYCKFVLVQWLYSPNNCYYLHQLKNYHPHPPQKKIPHPPAPTRQMRNQPNPINLFNYLAFKQKVASIILFQHLPAAVDGDFCVDLCGNNAGMAQQLLYIPDGSPVI